MARRTPRSEAKAEEMTRLSAELQAAEAAVRADVARQWIEHGRGIERHGHAFGVTPASHFSDPTPSEALATRVASARAAWASFVDDPEET